MCPELLQSAGILGFGFSEIQASRIDPGRIDRIVLGLNNRMDNGSVLNRTTSVRLFSVMFWIRVMYFRLESCSYPVKGGFEHSAGYNRHLNLWNECSHSEISFKTNTDCYFSIKYWRNG